VKPVNENGEIVPFLLIDGFAPSSDIEKNVNDNHFEKIKKVKSFSIEENVENEIVKTENEETRKSNANSEGSSEPNVVDAVSSGAVYVTGSGAGAEIEDESDSGDEIYEDANYYDSDSEFINMAQELDKIIMLCQTVTIQNEKVNVCYDYRAASPS
jgi:hypothetical protein